MDKDVLVNVEHVSKKFSKSLKRSMLYGVQDIGRNMVGLGSHSDILRKDEFWAVDDVSFQLQRGEALGIIGPNGSGKTTLLKMLNGIFWPDQGKISIRGRVGALISIGAGFHPLLTGRENIYINGAILGMSKKEIDEKFDDIVRFADIGVFLDAPVKFYSSGMYIRLGFAIAVHCEPDILLVDEILSVGDINFHRKCLNKLDTLLRSGTCLIFVSHNIMLVQRICHKSILLHNGKCLGCSDTTKIITNYYQNFQSIIESDGKFNNESPVESEVSLVRIKCYNSNGNETNEFKTGDYFLLKIIYHSHVEVKNPIYHVVFNNDISCGFSTLYDRIKTKKIFGNQTIELEIPFLGLGPGIYNVRVGVWDENFRRNYYLNWKGTTITVHPKQRMLGRFEFDHEWKIN